MSGGTVRRLALRRIAKLDASEPLKRVLASVLSKCRADAFQFFFDATVDALSDNKLSRQRCVAVAFQYAAVQLADDISDGDCDYLEDPRLYPLLLMILQTLFVDGALEAGVDQETLARVQALFLRVGAGQYRELTEKAHSAKDALRIASDLNGAQHAAYLEILWCSSAFSKIAQPSGAALGLLAHVVTDAFGNDARFSILGAHQRRLVMGQAARACSYLSRSPIRILRKIAVTTAALTHNGRQVSSTPTRQKRKTR